MDSHAHAAAPAVQQRTPSYAPGEEVDFVIVGAGAAGGIVARELSVAGFSVVVLEQGPYLREKDFRHDEIDVFWKAALTNDYTRQPNTLRRTENEVATVRPIVQYGRAVGGGTVHFTGNYWRFHEIDFIERSRKGPVAGAAMADWPITYAELEPYYTRVEWEIGVSGQAGASPFDPPRSRPYPLPPLPIKPAGVLLDRAARKMGWTSFPAPMAIISKRYRGREACVNCGFCIGFGCEMRAKSSTLVTMIPEAERTGRCEIRPNSYVRKVEISTKGRAMGVKYYDAERREVFQRAKAVVVCANGAETPRLLLMSKSNLFPQGLANSSGLVGRHFMFNGGAYAGGLFEHATNGYKGVTVSRVIHDTYELDPKLGLHGGGGFDLRFDQFPASFGIYGLPLDAPRWGPAFKKMVKEYFTRTLYILAHTTSLPVESNAISLDPTVKDAWGLPALRMTYLEHPNDMKLYQWFLDRSLDLLDAAGAQRTWGYPPTDQPPLALPHLLGTCRMGNDAAKSVVDRNHRTHDIPNLFLCDGSSLVTSGRGQPTMTIQALAFRAGEIIANFAKRNEI